MRGELEAGARAGQCTRGRVAGANGAGRSVEISQKGAEVVAGFVDCVTFPPVELKGRVGRVLLTRQEEGG